MYWRYFFHFASLPFSAPIFVLALFIAATANHKRNAAP